MIRPPRKSAGISVREDQVSGYPVRYGVMGEGEPVVLVHDPSRLLTRSVYRPFYPGRSLE